MPLPTIILRHRRENLKKCSLRGLEKKENFHFYTYPVNPLPSLQGYVLLSFEGPLLSSEDSEKGIFLIDGTWRHAATMFRTLPYPREFELRSLPTQYKTAYPRRQDDCPDPLRGLASIEALYIAFHILGRNTEGLLDGYFRKEDFLRNNSLFP